MLMIATVGGLLFALGYYLGDQVGRTAHIRDHLRQLRELRQGVERAR